MKRALRRWAVFRRNLLCLLTVLQVVCAAVPAGEIHAGSEEVLDLFQIPESSEGPATLSRRGRREVRFDAGRLLHLRPGSRVRLNVPGLVEDGEEIVFERAALSPHGSITWIGTLEHDGVPFRTVITQNGSAVTGTIQRFSGTLRVETSAGRQSVLDPEAAGLDPLVDVHGADALIPWVPSLPGLSAAVSPAAGGAALSAGAAGNTTIDVMIVYTKDLVNRLGSAGAHARLDHLVALSNQAFADSGVAVALRDVHRVEIDYPSHITNPEALYDLSDNATPFHEIDALRDEHGADLVILVRPFLYPDQTSCGTAWLNGYLQTPMHADFGYSVVSDGISSGRYCLDTSFVHELGTPWGWTTIGPTVGVAEPPCMETVTACRDVSEPS